MNPFGFFYELLCISKYIILIIYLYDIFYVHICLSGRVVFVKIFRGWNK